MPIFLSVGICNKKLPFPALGSTTKSQLSQLYFEPIVLIQFDEIAGIV